ncbi:arginyl-tRNA synthetase [Roseomonas rosea]|uniref:Arginine--tRNA ligase n=1 Tax=Muricoccus roseus TaxID=198092 RepID=A0A1M6F449_9PROT|nr:arginine--tRNA ligase [Roseomonas rosea]SHI92498.1 arginyl-tRNA synthetase [Roseomonas rosea]
MNHDIFRTIRDAVVTELRALLPDLPEELLARVLVEPPRDPSHGDMATNAALVVAKPARMPPQKVAQDLSARLTGRAGIVSAAPAGPGFVNLRLEESLLRAQLPIVLRAAEAYGDGRTGGGRKVDVEYVSANPTGPMHVGHCRGAVVGDALANLLTKAGWAVTKEYYINDAGAQVQALAWAAFWRYLEAAARAGHAGRAVLRSLATSPPEQAREIVENAFGVSLQYGGDYLVPVGEALLREFGDRLIPAEGEAPSEDTLSLVRERAVTMMMAEIREDLAALGVHHDVFISEAALVKSGAADRAIAELAARGLVYEGVLEPPKGKLPDDWEPREQTLFRSTEFGDDVDRPLRKSDGTNTYFANDIGNHADKIARGFDELVQVWGADHGGYVPRMKAAVAALSADKPVSFDVVLAQIVKVVKGGQPVRMSKRAGTYVTLRDLIDEVGRDAVRFTMLTRKADAQMEFDLDAVVQQSRDNPVFYVQYAHARCRSVLRQAGEPAAADLAAAPLEALADPAEMALIRRLTAWPRTVEGAALAREPHRIAFFLHDLAADFHLLWNRGRDDATLRFIREGEPEATRARLALVAATATVIRSGLAVMGVTPVEEMR